MFDQKKHAPDAADLFAASPPSVPPSVATQAAPRVTAPGQPAANPNATHPSSWAAQLNASLFDDDVATLTSEERAKREALDRLRKEYLGAKASDGMLDQLEGEALRQKAHELGTDRMSFADSMYARGMDPAQVHAVLEKLRGVDSARPGDAAAEHRDHNQNPLASPAALTADDKAVWREAMATRYDDMHAAYTTQGGVPLEATPMEKLIDEKQSNTLATGVFDDKGAGHVVPPTVGGFIGMASHSAGLGSTARLQMAGLDSAYHAQPNIGWFDDSANQWTWKTSGPHGGVDKLGFPATSSVVDNAQVPMGDAAYDLCADEASRLERREKKTAAGVGEYTARLFERDAGGTDLANVVRENRKAGDHTNPYTGWGFSATRRAQDGTGGMLPVLDNQELKLKNRVSVEAPSSLSAVSSSGAESKLADFVAGSGGATRANIVTTDAARRQGMWDYADRLGQTPSWPRP